MVKAKKKAVKKVVKKVKKVDTCCNEAGEPFVDESNDKPSA